MVSFLKVFRGGSDSAAALRSDLKVATDSGVIEVHKELIAAVVEKSQHEEDRKVIMSHLRECLAEPQGKRWKRVHAGLVLLENLVQDGSPELILEASEGRHFDVVQRVSLLEKFEYTSDVRAQKMVRAKATALRSFLISRMQNAEAAAPAKDEILKDSRSTCSPGELSNASQSTACTEVELDSKTQISNETVAAVFDSRKPAGMMMVNGMCRVGHNDDTTSDSSGGDARKKAVQGQRKVVRKTRRERGQNSNYSSDSDAEPANPMNYVSQKSTPAPVAAQSVDLLGF